MTNLRNIKIVLWIVASLLLIIIGISTINVLSITDNPAFKIDFENKHQIISGYAALIGAILSFLSIIFVLYNIVQQNYQYEEEKKAKEKKELNLLFDRILLVDNLLKEITGHIINTGKKMKEFTNSEREKPLVNNFLDFYSSKQFYRLLELDYNSIYRSFQQFLPKDKEKFFNSLYSITDFYSEILPELKEIIKIHLSEKYNRRLVIVEEVKKILDLSSGILKNTKDAYRDDYENNDLYTLFNNLILDYYELVQRNEKEKKETDLDELSKKVFFPFLDKYVKLDSNLTSYDTEMIANRISNVRKDIHSIKIDALAMADQIEERQKAYFIESSEQILRIEEIRNMLKSTILAKKINSLNQE